MYNSKDIQFVGKHDFDRESAEKFAGYSTKTFSINIFKWELKGNRKEMKRGNCVVRVRGNSNDIDSAFKFAESIVKLLDEGKYTGPKNATVK